MPLVDYSDSEGDDDDDEQPPPQPQLQPAPQPQPQPAPAPEQPPAKKQKKEINLQSLLQKHDAALPFEEANSLPSDFFDSDRVREPDAGESSNAQPAARGWAALSSLLPAPKNAPKPGAKSADPSALFRNAKPLKKPGNGSSSTAGSSSSTAALPPPTTTSLPLVADDDGDEDDDDNDASGGLLPRQSALPAPSLMPKINVGMYDTTADDAAAQPQDDSSLMYAAPVGPAMGPMDAAAIWDEIVVQQHGATAQEMSAKVRRWGTPTDAIFDLEKYNRAMRPIQPHGAAAHGGVAGPAGNSRACGMAALVAAHST